LYEDVKPRSSPLLLQPRYLVDVRMRIEREREVLLVELTDATGVCGEGADGVVVDV
jgi:hypothetical protein